MFARLISETKIDTNAPRSAVIDGSTVCGQLPEDYLNSIGWYRLEETPMPQDAPEGYHAEPRYAYDDAETPTRVVRSWALVQDPPPPPVDYSKRKLYRVFLERGVWADVRGFMEAMGCWEDWEYATTLQSDDPLMATAIPPIQQLLGVTDEEMREILASCEVGAQ